MKKNNDLDYIERKRDEEKETISFMIELYCKKNHSKRGTDGLCEECKNLSEYVNKRIDNCPNMATKTFCARCANPCYKKDMKEKIKEVMKFSGKRMIFHRPSLVFKHALSAFKKNR